MPRSITALSLTAAMTAAASAGDCTPTWDLEFGQPGANAGNVFDYVVHEGRLYASGTFTAIDGVAASRIARWTGTTWAPLGSGIANNEVYSVASFAGDVYAAGYFDSAGGVAGTAKIARWDGSTWHSLNAQLELFSNQLWDMATWDDGNGEALYVAGNYQNAGGVANASYISKWDGESFSALGTPIGGAVPLIVFTVHTWDDGSGQALYVGGRFLSIDGVPANRVAKYDGETWSALGSGLTGPGLSPAAISMAAFDDGSGEQLYVAGQTFNMAGGMPVSRIARWDGEQWSTVGEGFADGIVWDLEVFDDGDGAALYAFGTFTASGATPLSKVARWDGSTWAPLPGGGANADTYAGVEFEDSSGRALYVGGSYTSIGGIGSNRIARLYACPDEGNEGDVNGDGVVNVSDLVQVIVEWGDCPDPPEPCDADTDGNGVVNVGDLIAVIVNWS